jgi:SigmaK-factor processing regulatory protein BofA
LCEAQGGGSGGGGAYIEWVVLLIVVGLFLAVLLVVGWGIRLLWALLINAVVGLVLIFLTNLFLSPPIPINILTILISAIGGVVGWLIILMLHLLGLAFV